MDVKNHLSILPSSSSWCLRWRTIRTKFIGVPFARWPTPALVSNYICDSQISLKASFHFQWHPGPRGFSFSLLFLPLFLSVLFSYSSLDCCYSWPLKKMNQSGGLNCDIRERVGLNGHPHASSCIWWTRGLSSDEDGWRIARLIPSQVQSLIICVFWACCLAFSVCVCVSISALIHVCLCVLITVMSWFIQQQMFLIHLAGR